MPRQFIDEHMAQDRREIWIDQDSIETRLYNLRAYAQERHDQVKPQTEPIDDWYEQEEKYISQIDDLLTDIRTLLVRIEDL